MLRYNGATANDRRRRNIHFSYFYYQYYYYFAVIPFMLFRTVPFRTLCLVVDVDVGAADALHSVSVHRTSYILYMKT